jgi:GTPase SAR1 family protein
MEINRDLLKQVTAKTSNKQGGIGSLPRSLHKSPDTREWVTLETVALVPIPVQRLGEWGLVSLLTVSQKQKNGMDGYAVPWGVVEWNANTMQFTKKLDLREIKANSSLWQSKVISKHPADTSVEINPQIRTLRENFLYSTLDDFCENLNRGKEEFSQLARHYSGILPKEIYSYYHDLVPESKEWLISDSPAISLQISSAKEQILDDLDEKLKTPSDLADRLLNWLSQCEEFANYLSIENREIGEQMVALLKTIERRRSLPSFRLTFVGEFSRGKSHLVNRLLGRNVLPEGALPTTATITSILAGEEDCMEVKIAGKTEIRSLEESSWEDLLATDSAGTDAEVFAGLRIRLNHEWLRSLDVEIIDTPGAGDLSDRRAAMISDILSQSDAAVLLVSATFPFSMTEAAFLEQEVIGRHVPRIMVAVSKLDTIPPEQRGKVMQSIRYRIAEVSANVPILST